MAGGVGFVLGNVIDCLFQVGCGFSESREPSCGLAQIETSEDFVGRQPSVSLCGFFSLAYFCGPHLDLVKVAGDYLFDQLVNGATRNLSEMFEALFLRGGELERHEQTLRPSGGRVNATLWNQRGVCVAKWTQFLDQAN